MPRPCRNDWRTLRVDGFRRRNRPGVVKSRNALVGVAYNNPLNVDERSIDTHIKRLRKKFMASDSEFDSVQTLYGVGYRFKET